MKIESRTAAAIYLLPLLVLLVGLLVVPVVYSLILTMTDLGGAPGQLGSWVGLDNWSRIWPSVVSTFPFLETSDRLFDRAFIQTVLYVIPSVIGATVLGLLIALALNQEFRGRAFVRASLLIPWAIPPVVVASMFQWFLDSRRGLFPYWLERLGIVDELARLGFGVANDGSILFFSDGWLPSWMAPITGLMATFLGIHLWKTVSLVAIIFLVALQYLPKDTLYAARLDGARFRHRLRYILLPHLWPAIVSAIIVQFLLTVTMFDIIISLGSGGVKESVLNVYVYAYRTSFFLNDLGYGSVLAYVVSAMTLVFALMLTRGKLRAPL